jgi:hypothetical protein
MEAIGNLLGTCAARHSFDHHNGGLNMFKFLDIQERMEVVGSDDRHVGVVDHKEAEDRIILSKDDPQSGGRYHLISIDWVAYVDGKVHLNRPSQKAISEWQAAA